MLESAVVLIIFNRPDTTERVFAEIARAKPTKLLVIADGPRPDRSDDAEKCAAARAIVERVDWECDVLKNYSDVNLGCGRRPATGISWVFEHVEEAIILEDDCVPHPTFFRFCQELLDKYQDDERVMMIGGTNSLFGLKPTEYSYFFSRVPTCWGWATWGRAWEHFDYEMKAWPHVRDTSMLYHVFGTRQGAEFWKGVFEKAYRAGPTADHWDYQWNFACAIQSGFTILPKSNLVSNIGFGENATHTKDTRAIAANIPTEEMKFPLGHPPYMVWDRGADRIRFEQDPSTRRFREEGRGERRTLYLRLRQQIFKVITGLLRKPPMHNQAK